MINPNKPGKFRRVLNGASKSHGPSSKTALLVDRDLIQNLLAVIMRFRRHWYCVSADNKRMFFQVGVLADDQPSLRFLWREETTTYVVKYQNTRNFSLGGLGIPTCTTFVLQKILTIKLFSRCSFCSDAKI